MDRLASPLLALFASLNAAAAPVVARPDWQRHFDAQGLRGTFVLFEPGQDRYLAWDEARARRRFLPASTFKLPHAVIGLETGAIADEHEVFAWDGKPRLRAVWERDQTFGSAIADGTVWVFQEVARRIGKARMRQWLERLDYGNRDIAGGIDLFWLQGALRVSAYEQVRFLHRLAEGRLPATQRSQRLVREAMVVEKTRDYTLFAKTGTTGAVREPVAWWVGWIERKGRVVACFAMNHDMRRATPYAARFIVSRAILNEAAGLPRAATAEAAPSP
jgi:beta-lactamase class D